MILQLVLTARKEVLDVLGELPSVVDEAEQAHASAVVAAVEFNNAITHELRSSWENTAETTAAYETTARLNYSHKVRQLRRAIRRLEVVLDGAERAFEENDGTLREQPGELLEALVGFSPAPEPVNQAA